MQTSHSIPKTCINHLYAYGLFNYRSWGHIKTVNIRSKLTLVVIASILFSAIPATFVVKSYVQKNILEKEINDIISITDHQTDVISKRFWQAEPKLKGLARLLQEAIKKPTSAEELNDFYTTMELNQDGVWRNRRSNYEGLTESGIFLPPNSRETDQQKVEHLRIKRVMDTFGSAASKRNENIWFLSLDRSEVIFDKTFPNFVYEQQADNDYTKTPWVTYTSPEYNPKRELIFTPPLFDPVPRVWMVSALYPLDIDQKWIGTIGEDMQLTNVLAFMFQQQQYYPDTQHFLTDKNGQFILAGEWQNELESSQSGQLDLKDESQLNQLLTTELSVEANLISQRVQVRGRDYIAVGMMIEPVNWNYFRLVPIDNIVQPIREFLVALGAIVFLVAVVCGVLIRLSVDKLLVNRLRQLAEYMHHYESDRTTSAPLQLEGSDEIGNAATEFNTMIKRIEHYISEIDITKSALAESEQRWKFALEGAGDGMWDWHIQAGKVVFSNQWKEMLGYKDHELPNILSSWEDNLHPDDKARVKQCLDDYFNNKKSDYIIQFRMRSKDGSWKWILARGMIVERDQTLNPIRMLGTHTDITHIKSIELELRSQSDQLKEMLEVSPIGVRIATKNGLNIQFVNKKYAELVNSDKSALLGSDPSKYYADKKTYQSIVQKINNDVSVSNQLIELTLPTSDNKWVLASYFPLNYESEKCVLGWFYDITDRLKAEESLRLNASVFDNAWEGIVITDASNTILRINQAFTEITGYTSEEIIGQKPKILSSGRQTSDFYREMWRELYDSGHWRGEVWNRKKSGELYAEILTLSTVKNSDGDITHYVGVFADITRMKTTEQQLEQLAHYDPLTKLPNRILLSDRLAQDLAQAKRNQTLLVICFLDLDGFKAINDTLGHAMGDKLLIEIGTRLSNEVRNGDTVARIGGDEFIILLSNLKNIDELDTAITRINQSISKPVIIAEHTLSVTASIGATVYPKDNSDADTLIRHADNAMYAAKQSGKNTYHIFDPLLDRQMHELHENISRIEQALHQNEFRLYYQPKVNLITGEILGLEALIRWQHPERGLLAPGEFLPLIENKDIIVTIGDWVIEQALQQAHDWQKQELTVQISVNVAAKQVQETDFIDKLDHALARHPDVASELLELEILETSALETFQTAEIVTITSQQLGVTFALDDFGTGYSSLSYLRQLPVKTLKIDQTFVRDILDDIEDRAIIEAIVELAKVFKLNVIAEGVETKQQAQLLVELGCEVAQGYGISKPMPAGEVLDWCKHYVPTLDS